MKNILRSTLFLLSLVSIFSCQKTDNITNATNSSTEEHFTKKTSLGTYQSVTTAASTTVSEITLSKTGSTITASRSTVTSSETDFKTINLTSITISSTTGEFTIPASSSGSTYWLIPFNTSDDPVKITGFDPEDYSISCGCTQTGKCGVNNAGQPDNVFRCTPSPAPDDCTGECTMKVTSPTPGNVPVVGGSLLVEATTIVLNGTTFN